MKILVINAGSSSLKYQIIDMKYESVLAKGVCDRIGSNSSFIKHKKTGSEIIVIMSKLPDHKTTMEILVNIITDAKHGVVSDMSEIDAVGHRVVHGGENFSDSVIINDIVMDGIKDCIKLAPLHNPANIIGIEACRKVMPETPMIAVFDTAFHQTIPQYAYIYSVPYEAYEEYGIRKYGFHGTSHKYVAERTSMLLGKKLEEVKIISCHLGNGASICAIKNGKSIDTSMGFTPLAGLAMGTRSGTIDPSAILYLMDKKGMSVDEMNEYLNKKSGILGVSGESSDFRDIHRSVREGNKKAQLAIDIFCYKVKKYIGEYAAAMGGVDALVFTAGIGENDAIVRKKVLEGMEYMGICIDWEKNDEILLGAEGDISTEASEVRTFVVPTNEELAIAREVKRLIEHTA